MPSPTLEAPPSSSDDAGVIRHHEVTGLAPSRRCDRLVLEVDGSRVGHVSGVEVARHGLFKGRGLDTATLARVRHEVLRLAACDRALSMLAARDRTCAGMARRLVEKGIATDIAQEAVEQLRAAGWLDDRRFMRNWIRTRSRSGHGPVRLRRDLALEGVEAAMIERGLEETLAEVREDMEDALLQATRRRQAALHHLDERSRERRLRSFLVRQGHSWDAIGRLLAQVAEA